jgi:adenylate kinase family enzyme
MSMPHGIILLGANGSGKSTLGRELARALNFAHFDVEDYWFYKTYIRTLPFDQRKNGMVLHVNGANHWQI